MSKVETELNSELQSLLNGKELVLLNIYDHEIKRNITTALSWAYAIDQKRIRFAIDSKSRVVELSNSGEAMSITLIGNERVYSIAGTPAVKVEKTEDMTLKMAIIEIEVEEVRDITFYGAKITQRPEYIKTYNEKLIKQLDEEVKNAVSNI